MRVKPGRWPAVTAPHIRRVTRTNWRLSSRGERPAGIYASAMGARGGSELERGEIEVAGVRRSYWLARAPRRHGQAPPPLLIALHGSGMDGRGMAWFTGLARRGPAAGITTVFPDGWKGAWHPARPPAASPTWTTRGSSPNSPATWRGSARPGRGRSSSPGSRRAPGTPSTWPGTACCR